MRGKAGCRLREVECGRITPACAGKSHEQVTNKLQTRDHPRVCGEKTDTSVALTTTEGSPPRVRGKDER